MENISIDEAMKFAEERINFYALKIKLIYAECVFEDDKTKLKYYFTAQERADFRELVKDLAANFKVYIELRQISDKSAAEYLEIAAK